MRPTLSADGLHEFEIPAAHPALSGHFPGDPIVPGVVLLTYVVRAARQCLGEDIVITAWPQAKFTALLRPEERFFVQIEARASGDAAFHVSSRSGSVANGLFTYARRSQ